MSKGRQICKGYQFIHETDAMRVVVDLKDGFYEMFEIMDAFRVFMNNSGFTLDEGEFWTETEKIEWKRDIEMDIKADIKERLDVLEDAIKEKDDAPV